MIEALKQIKHHSDNLPSVLPGTKTSPDNAILTQVDGLRVKVRRCWYWMSCHSAVVLTVSPPEDEHAFHSAAEAVFGPPEFRRGENEIFFSWNDEEEIVPSPRCWVVVGDQRVGEICDEVGLEDEELDTLRRYLAILEWRQQGLQRAAKEASQYNPEQDSTAREPREVYLRLVETVKNPVRHWLDGLTLGIRAQVLEAADKILTEARKQGGITEEEAAFKEAQAAFALPPDTTLTSAE